MNEGVLNKLNKSLYENKNYKGDDKYIIRRTLNLINDLLDPIVASIINNQDFSKIWYHTFFKWR